MEYLTLSAWARVVGISRKRAMEWVGEGRIEVYRPTIGVLLVPKTQDKPIRNKPWSQVKPK